MYMYGYICIYGCICMCIDTYAIVRWGSLMRRCRPHSHQDPHVLLLPTAYCLLPTSHFLLPTAYCLPPNPLPPTSYFPLPTSYCLSPTAYLLLPTSHCLLPTSYFPLPTSYLPPSHFLPPTSHCLQVWTASVERHAKINMSKVFTQF